MYHYIRIIADIYVRGNMSRPVEQSYVFNKKTTTFIMNYVG